MKYMVRYIGSAGTEMLGFLIVFVMTFLSIYIIAWLAAYICKGVGLYTMAKRENLPCPWLAFVPVVRAYIQGELCGDITFGKKKIRDLGIWLVVLPFLYGVVLNAVWVFAMLSVSGMIVSYRGMIGYSRFLGSLGFSAAVLVGVVVIAAALVAAALYKAAYIFINQKIFGKYTSETMKTVHAVLSALVPLYEAVAFLALRNRPLNGGEADMAGEEPTAREPQTSETVQPEETPQMPETAQAEGEPRTPETVQPEREPQMSETAQAEAELQTPETAQPEETRETEPRAQSENSAETENK